MTRTFRPQFTLRLLLLAMLLFGIALGVWRWPWVEEKRNSEQILLTPIGLAVGLPWEKEFRRSGLRARIHYRRDWNGVPRKHGPAEYFYDNDVLAIRQIWRDGILHGVESWFDQQGRLVAEQTWRDGARQGFFRIGNGEEWFALGQYTNSRLHGELRERAIWFNGDRVWRVSQFAQNFRFDSFRWETLQGEVLRSAEYDTGRLTRWNDVAVTDYLHEWSISGKITNDRIARALRTNKIVENQFGPYEVFMTIQLVEDKHDVFILRDPSLPEALNPFRGSIRRTPLSRDLITTCLPWGLAIDWRYENLYVVPAEDVGHWRDPTGVAELDVSRFSKLAAIWNKPFRDGSRYPNQNFTQREELYIRWPTECGVELDLVTHFPEWHERVHKLRGIFGVDKDAPDEIFPTMQAWLGARLYHLGLQCELQGNRLVILPHWTERKANE